MLFQVEALKLTTQPHFLLPKLMRKIIFKLRTYNMKFKPYNCDQVRSACALIAQVSADKIEAKTVFNCAIDLVEAAESLENKTAAPIQDCPQKP